LLGDLTAAPPSFLVPAIAQEARGANRSSPPRHAVVLSIDEKSQIQALDRTLHVIVH